MRLTHGKRFRSLLRLVLVAAAVFVTALPVASARAKPRLELRAGRLEVVGPDAGGSPRRHVLRENIYEALLIAAGGDASGLSAFVTWQEGNSGAWTAFSRDAGETWSTPRRFRRTVELRDGSVPSGGAMPVVDRRLSAGPDQSVYLIQLYTVSLPGWRAVLAERGAEILSYFPHHAFLARLPAGMAASIKALDFVDRVEPFHPAYRIERSLREWALEAEDSEDSSRRQIAFMTFGRGREARAAVDSFLRASGATVVENGDSSRIIRAVVNRREVQQLAVRDDVMWLEPWAPPIDSLDIVRVSSGATEVENYHGYCGTGVVGEVFDGGIFDCPEYPESPSCVDHFEGVRYHRAYTPDETTAGLDIGTVVWPFPDNFDGVPHGEAPLPGLLAQHGTPVYGILFNPDPPEGLLHCGTGIVADRTWMAIPPYPPPSEGLVDRFDHTAELKGAPYFASFQTNSFGTAHTPSYDLESQDLDDIVWQLDIAITQALGNTGTRTAHAEGWSKNAISVGGIHHLDTSDTTDDRWCHSENCELLSESECPANPMCVLRPPNICHEETCDPVCKPVSCASIGPAADERIKPDVHFWYDRINTTWWVEDPACTGDPIDSSYCVTYANFGGTSAATPTVAGILGIMVEMWADNVWGTEPIPGTVFDLQPHASTIKALLINNAYQYPFSGATHDLTRVHQGWGRPNASLAFRRAARSFVVDESIALDGDDDEVTFEFAVPQYENELKVTLAYSDPPANPSATVTLVNDLDLIVRSPSGATYNGNHGLDTGNYSIPGGETNSVDNVENVFIASPPDGIWQVKVRASHINEDAYLATPYPEYPPDVVFALVATGVLPPEAMHIQDVTVTTSTKGKQRVRGSGAVTVVDQDGAPVAGAEVLADWHGPVLLKRIALTDASGVASFETEYVRTSTYCFTLNVRRVTVAGRTYTPSANVETSDQAGNACP